MASHKNNDKKIGFRMKLQLVKDKEISGKEWKRWLLYHKPVTYHKILRSSIKRRCIVITSFPYSFHSILGSWSRTRWIWRHWLQNSPFDAFLEGELNLVSIDLVSVNSIKNLKRTKLLDVKQWNLEIIYGNSTSLRIIDRVQKIITMIEGQKETQNHYPCHDIIIA